MNVIVTAHIKVGDTLVKQDLRGVEASDLLDELEAGAAQLFFRGQPVAGRPGLSKTVILRAEDVALWEIPE